MDWLYLILAGICEMFGVAMITKVNQDRSWKSVSLLLAGFGASFLFLTFAMQTMAMSTAYAVWTGIGASGAAVLGMVVYKEPTNIRRLLFIILVLGSSVGLKFIA
jgi:paired small multidrug resistance pump